ncbi:uncharacterized protein LOC105216426 isoform X1 [Zeugodacus cucurbitae]|nr:uncharacterized protein LOC105216426 isoform X1 [Zeugodacus cucurbitae]
MKYFRKLFIILFTIISLTKFISGAPDENKGAVDGSESGENVSSEYSDSEDEYYDYDGGVEYYDGSNEPKMELPEDCVSLKYLKLKRICDGLYPAILAENYEDILADMNEPFAVFQFPYEDTNRYFLTFQHSDIFNCQYLQVIDVLNYRCSNESGETKDILMKRGIMRCMRYESDAIDLLLGMCSKQLNESSVFTALHYSQLLTIPRSAGGKEELRMEWCLHVGFVTL